MSSSPVSGLRPPSPGVSLDDLEQLLKDLNAPTQPVSRVVPNAFQVSRTEITAFRSDFEEFKAKVSRDLKNLQGQVTKILQILILLQNSDLGFKDVKEEIDRVSNQFKELNERQTRSNALIEKFTSIDKDVKSEKDSKNNHQG